VLKIEKRDEVIRMALAKERGFTLLELLIVLIIIGLLTLIALPKYAEVVDRAKVAEAYVFLGTYRVIQESYIYVNGEPADDIEDLKIPQPYEEVAYFNYGTKKGVGFVPEEDERYMIYAWSSDIETADDEYPLVHIHEIGPPSVFYDQSSGDHEHGERLPSHSHTIPASEERSADEKIN